MSSQRYAIRVKFIDGRERYLSPGKTIWHVREEAAIPMTALEVGNAAATFITSPELSEVTIVRLQRDIEEPDTIVMEVKEQ